jgi:hypothetical protein
MEQLKPKVDFRERYLEMLREGHPHLHPQGGTW